MRAVTAPADRATARRYRTMSTTRSEPLQLSLPTATHMPAQPSRSSVRIMKSLYRLSRVPGGASTPTRIDLSQRTLPAFGPNRLGVVAEISTLIHPNGILWQYLFSCLTTLSAKINGPGQQHCLCGGNLNMAKDDSRLINFANKVLLPKSRASPDR